MVWDADDERQSISITADEWANYSPDWQTNYRVPDGATDNTKWELGAEVISAPPPPHEMEYIMIWRVGSYYPSNPLVPQYTTIYELP